MVNLNGKENDMKINEVAKLTGVTVRTLHYYDEFGLLKPSTITENGYRIYDEKNLETLQEILFFRELDFPLSDIKNIMLNPSYNKNEALKHHKEILIQKRDRLNNLIRLCNSTMKGELDMSFTQFDKSTIENLTKATKERYGSTKEYAESMERTKNYTSDDYARLELEATELFAKFAENKHLPPDDEKVQHIVKEWQIHISKNFYTCSDEILKHLGQTYLEDDFRENIDKVGAGTAEFMAEAIKYFCK